MQSKKNRTIDARKFTEMWDSLGEDEPGDLSYANLLEKIAKTRMADGNLLEAFFTTGHSLVQRTWHSIVVANRHGSQQRQGHPRVHHGTQRGY